MKQIRTSSQFRKDVKRYAHQPSKMAALKEVVDLLAEDKPLPASYLAHRLGGTYKGYLECHIESDFLLIWYDKNENYIELIRLGSHSELFGHK